MSQAVGTEKPGVFHILDDDTIKIPKAKLELCLIHFYDQVFESGKRKILSNLFWICTSSALSIFIMFITSEFKPLGEIPASTIQTIMLIVEVVLILLAVLTGVYLATKSFKEERDVLIKDMIEVNLLQTLRKRGNQYYDINEDDEEDYEY